MKKRIISILTLVMVAAMLAVGVNASAYPTYTYGYSSNTMLSPDAYVPERVVTMQDIGLTEESFTLRDLEVDKAGNVYIVDAAANRVIVTDRYYKLKFEITTFENEYGVVDSFNNPSGVCITDKYIYVADTSNNRIVMFDLDGNYYKIVPKPESAYFEDDSLYMPVALAVGHHRHG